MLRGFNLQAEACLGEVKSITLLIKKHVKPMTGVKGGRGLCSSRKVGRKKEIYNKRKEGIKEAAQFI